MRLATTLLILAFFFGNSNATEPLAWLKQHHIADNLEAGVSLGTTGIGIEAATPVTNWAKLRLGFDGVPPFKIPLDFSISTYAGENVAGRLDKIRELMLDVTGEKMGETGRVYAKPNLWNFKMLVDVFPIPGNRHWHVTAGFYAGSKTIGTAINAANATNTLVAMNIYNRFYRRMAENGYENEPFFGDIYLTKEKYDEIMSYGELGIYLGETKDGKPYYLHPSSSGTVSAKAVVNAIKPYFGAGYNTSFGNTKRWTLSADAGFLIWGGAPQVILDDGTNMNRELKNVRGKVGKYLDLMKNLPVYPNASVRISYTFF